MKPSLFIFVIAATSIFCDTYAEDFAGAVRQKVLAAPAGAPETVTEVLRASGSQAAKRASLVVRGAIEGLGAHPAPRSVGAIVYAAVRAVPNAVLPIVRAAVAAAPPEAAPAIAAAAASAVPHPWQRVRLGGPAVVATRGERDFKSSDGKTSVRETTTRAPSDPRVSELDPNLEIIGDPGTSLEPGSGVSGLSGVPSDAITLAEAIAQVAFEAQAGLSFSALVAAIDNALLLDPANLLHHVDSPRSISGVGDAGNNNYANEPLRRVQAPSLPAIPPVSP